MSNFCSACGGALLAGAGFCAVCGAKVGQAVGAPQAGFAQPTYAGATKFKLKTTSVLLAVFLGYWTWLYTFKKDKVKFFIGLGVGLMSSVIGLVSYVINNRIQDQLVSCYTSAIMGYYDMDLCTSTYKYSFTLSYITMFIGFGVWLWAVIDSARKPKSFFDNY